ncbi:MAG: hypothetical protein K9N51_12285 [Candidatus Pacebacteria bacterium]|nr:hypothetical protein [Candidatus Paceibacterota bacterium]
MFVKKHLDLCIVALFLLYFLFKATYFAFTVPVGMPPDEYFHYLQSQLFHQTSGLYVSPEGLNAYHGTRSRTFYLYHLAMGKMLFYGSWLPLDAPTFLRLVNVLFAAVYLAIFYMLARLLLRHRWLAAFAFVVHTNLLMFTFLAGAINSDNLVNLLSMCAIFLLFKSIIQKRPLLIYPFLWCLCLGALTKKTFLPVAAILVVICVFEYRAALWRVIVEKGRGLRWRAGGAHVACVAILVLLIGANALLHGYNLLHYGSIVPKCTQVYSEEKCAREHPVYAKYKKLGEAKDDREGAVLDPVRYLVAWFDYMTEKVIGIFAYASYYPGNLALGLVEAVIAVALVLGVRRVDWKDKHILYAVVTVGFYVLVLAYLVNYKSYLNMKLMPRYSFIGVQGRYIFPVISLIVILLSKCLLTFKRPLVNACIGVAVACLFITISFPAFYGTPADQRFVPNNKLQTTYRNGWYSTQDFIYP